LQQVVLCARALGTDLEPGGPYGAAGDVDRVVAGLDVGLQRRRVPRADGRRDLLDARTRAGRVGALERHPLRGARLMVTIREIGPAPMLRGDTDTRWSSM
jgi:hypothetical protein